MNKECLKAEFKNYKISNMKLADMLYNFKEEDCNTLTMKEIDGLKIIIKKVLP